MVRTEKRTVKIPDGTSMGAFMASPDGVGPYPGIIVCHEAFGVNAHIREVTSRFAAAGYVAMAPDFYHRSVSGFETGYSSSDLERGREQMAKMSDLGLEADLSAIYDVLNHLPQVAEGKIGSIGFCMGGRISFFANALLPIQGAVSFYGSRIAPGYLSFVERMRAPILMFWGGKDKNIPPEQTRTIVEALRASGKTFENMEFSDAEHGFFCDARSTYHRGAAQQAWRLTLEFLKTVFEN